MTKNVNPGAGELPATGDYSVGYKKPPVEHQFKPGHLRAGSQKASEKAPDIAALLDKPLRVKRAGKTVSIHPFEAELTSLGKRALKGEPRAARLFLKYCEAAGLLDPPLAVQTHGVFTIPRGADSRIMKVLLETYGLPPWDPEIYAGLVAEYESEQAHIEELYLQFMKEHENEQQT
jgi:uncharacterized protein DUF5681